MEEKSRTSGESESERRGARINRNETHNPEGLDAPTRMMLILFVEPHSISAVVRLELGKVLGTASFRGMYFVLKVCETPVQLLATVGFFACILSFLHSTDSGNRG